MVCTCYGIIGTRVRPNSLANSPAERMIASGVRRAKAALSSGCEAHPAIAPAGSSRSSYGGDEIAEAFGKRVTKYGDSASVQAAT